MAGSRQPYQCHDQHGQANCRDDPPCRAWRCVLKAYQHLVFAFGHPQSDKTLGAGHLYLHLLTIHVGPPAGEVESIQAQDELFGRRDGEAVVERPVRDDIDASAAGQTGTIDLVHWARPRIGFNQCGLRMQRHQRRLHRQEVARRGCAERQAVLLPLEDVLRRCGAEVRRPHGRIEHRQRQQQDRCQARRQHRAAPATGGQQGRPARSTQRQHQVGRSQQSPRELEVDQARDTLPDSGGHRQHQKDQAEAGEDEVEQP